MNDRRDDKTIDILLVDDDADLLEDISKYFEKRGYRVQPCQDGQHALELASRRAFDVAIVDMVLPETSGLDLLAEIKKTSSECEVLMLTGKGTIESAVEAMKLGAYDYLTKPVTMKELDAVVGKAREAGQLRKENQQLRAVLKKQQTKTNIVGQSPRMEEIYRLIERTAVTDKPILIQGESGTGKELVARAIHEASALSDKPLVVINCAALPETLLESELFGHEKGAFTGAVSVKPGLFEVADGGTLFIDEIGELAGPLQAKLLRVLEDGTLRRLGSVKERRVHVRLIAATNRDMAKQVRDSKFREDLFYRINVLTIDLPPLREREGDIRLLAQHFAGPNWKINQDVIETFERYGWPGNVRQLQNAIERAKILSDDDHICLENMPPEIIKGVQLVENHFPRSDLELDALNKMHIADTYQRYKGNKARTARALGVSRRALYRLLEKHEIDVGQDKPTPDPSH